MPEKNIENITQSGSNLAPILVNHHVLPDKNFNRQCLINNNVYIPKKQYIYIFLTY